MPTWKFWKRTWNESSDPGFLRRYYGTTKRSTLPASGLGGEPVNSKILDFSSVAILLASTIIVGALTLIVFRRYWRTEEVFTSPVRSDWQFTRHHQEGPETVRGESYHMIRRIPEDGHPVDDVNEHDTGEVRPEVTVFPLHEPWYAGTNHNADQDTEADTNQDGAGAARIPGSVTTPNDEQEEATFWIPRDALNERLFYYSPLTGVSTLESPIML